MLPDPSFHWYSLIVLFALVCWGVGVLTQSIRIFIGFWNDDAFCANLRSDTTCRIGIHLDWLYCGAWFRNCKHCKLLQQRKDSQWVTVPSRGTNNDEHYV